MIYLVFAGLIIWGGSQVARGFFAGFGYLPGKHVQSITPVVQSDNIDGHHSTHFELSPAEKLFEDWESDPTYSHLGGNVYFNAHDD